MKPSDNLESFPPLFASVNERRAGGRINPSLVCNCCPMFQVNLSVSEHLAIRTKQTQAPYPNLVGPHNIGHYWAVLAVLVSCSQKFSSKDPERSPNKSMAGSLFLSVPRLDSFQSKFSHQAGRVVPAVWLVPPTTRASLDM